MMHTAESDTAVCIVNDYAATQIGDIFVNWETIICLDPEGPKKNWLTKYKIVVKNLLTLSLMLQLFM